MNHGAFLDLTAEQSDPHSSAAAIIPVPYDATSSWIHGSARGPQAIIEASTHLEDYDTDTGWEPCSRGITTLAPIEHAGPPEDLPAKVEAVVGEVLQRGQLPIVLGGEHAVSVGAIRATAKSYGDLCVLQIDAHGDTRDEYHGSRYNHACVMARARECCPITQVGLRSVASEELPGMNLDRVWFAHQIIDDRERSWIPKVVETLEPSVYLTIDLDGFDPAYVPATGTPVPGGLSWTDVIALIDAVASSRRVVGFDVVELCPFPGLHASDFLAARLVYRTLAAVLERQ